MNYLLTSLKSYCLSTLRAKVVRYSIGKGVIIAVLKDWKTKRLYCRFISLASILRLLGVSFNTFEAAVMNRPHVSAFVRDIFHNPDPRQENTFGKFHIRGNCIALTAIEWDYTITCPISAFAQY